MSELEKLFKTKNLKFGDTVVKLTGNFKIVPDVHAMIIEVIGDYSEPIEMENPFGGEPLKMCLSYNEELYKGKFDNYIIISLGAFSRNPDKIMKVFVDREEEEDENEY